MKAEQCKQLALGRRDVLRLGLLAGLAGLSGCGGNVTNPLLRATPETLPASWRRLLPSPWRYQPLVAQAGQQPFTEALKQGADLLALSDGWLTSLPEQQLQPIATAPLEQRLDAQAKAFLDSLTPSMASRVLPVGVSPWVMVFRQGDPWLKEARNGWQVLLDPGLKGQLVLPNSPRLLMALADRMEAGDGLRRLLDQAITFDERYGLNWLLHGDARAAVLPLQRCLPSLRRDPRLSVVLPESGAPLHWTVLVRSDATREPVPQSWVEQAWSSPLLKQLLANGWIPPLSRAELQPAIRSIPKPYQQIVLPSDQVWSRCWSLPPLTLEEQAELEQRWSKDSALQRLTP
ncbi:MAG: ABC transporter substrate-binding protein [Prochlorococcus sp.]|nr:ABC transporter substrate-binding protein [Prochlorococcus sp.]MDP6193223.1 ABC transporter substrate-binding protein [Prochlorococcaceae cyanobacterium ETNP18_MAG_1]CAI8163938.1 MAG: Uncharacterised protein [Prochlorococcus marinus str. MIT 9215]